jgi:hypothetical protein
MQKSAFLASAAISSRMEFASRRMPVLALVSFFATTF